MIEYIKMDVTTPTSGVIMHGCNSHGVMGSGVALVVKNKFPIAYERYKSLCDALKLNRMQLMGLSQIVNVGSEKTDINSLFVANAITQMDYGKDGRVYADRKAIHEALRSTMIFAWSAGLPIYMPRIGCGLGGLNWDADVKPIVEEQASSAYGVDIFVCDF